MEAEIENPETPASPQNSRSLAGGEIADSRERSHHTVSSLKGALGSLPPSIHPEKQTSSGATWDFSRYGQKALVAKSACLFPVAAKFGASIAKSAHTGHYGMHF